MTCTHIKKDDKFAVIHLLSLHHSHLTYGLVLTEDRLRNITLWLHQTCPCAQQSPALMDFIFAPRTSPRLRMDLLLLIINVKDQTGDCVPAGNVQHNCNKSSDGKLDPVENQLNSHCILTIKCGKQCEIQTKDIWGEFEFLQLQSVTICTV